MIIHAMTNSGKMLLGNGVGAKPRLVKNTPIEPGIAGPIYDASGNRRSNVLNPGAMIWGRMRNSFRLRAKKGAALLVRI